MAELALQVKDLGDHCLALGWRLDLQEQTLGLRLSAVSPRERPQRGARRTLGAPRPAVGAALLGRCGSSFIEKSAQRGSALSAQSVLEGAASPVQPRVPLCPASQSPRPVWIRQSWGPTARASPSRALAPARRWFTG